MLRALRANVHRHLGFGSFAEYVDRLFGYGRRAVDDKLRMAMALEELPRLSQALRQGEVNASAARELSRVATRETEREWLEAARGRTVHQIERMVSGRSRGDRPADPADPATQRHVLRFEVSAETLAHVREAFGAIRRRSEDSLDDDAVLLLMARDVLAGPADEGRASYQVAITKCEQCRRGFQQAAGELVETGRGGDRDGELRCARARIGGRRGGRDTGRRCRPAFDPGALHGNRCARARLDPRGSSGASEANHSACDSTQSDATRPRPLRGPRLPSRDLRRLAPRRGSC